MTQYRRNLASGGTYFFTVNLDVRSSKRLVEEIAALRAAFRYTLHRHPVAIDAIVVLPDHLHAIWTLPAGDDDYALRWRLIKTHFSRSQPEIESVSASRKSKGERGIWQRRYWEHTIRDEQDLAAHVDYIHINPVKHGYVNRVIDWPHSSFHRLVREKTLSTEWAGSTRGLSTTDSVGERV